jgi:predicted nucleic acid-binding protein
LPQIALDTSVIIEYIDKDAEFQEQAKAVFTSLINGEFEAIIPHSILSEAYYVSARIYQKLGIVKPEAVSAELVEWLFRLPSVIIPTENKDLSIEAGRTKLKYRLSLTDCYVLAASQIYNCKALFKKPEKEMVPKINELKRSYQLVFLEDYK